MQRALIISAIALATGCSSAPDMPPVFSESFITNITPQGNHFFTYSATMNMQQGSRPGRGMEAPRGGMGGGPGGGMDGGPGGDMGSGPGGGNGGGPGGAPQKMRDNPEETAKERVAKIITDTGYCSNGWFVIDEMFDQGSAEIRGECRSPSD